MVTLLDPCWGIVSEGIWMYTGDDSSDEEGFANFPALVQSPGNKGHISKTKLRDDAPSAPRPAEQPDASFTGQMQLHPPKAAQSFS